jgi:benzoylformate decarboxylase
VPAAVGVALGDRAEGTRRTVVAIIGEGSSQYSVQAIWTAAQHRLPVVLRSGEYSILESFGELQHTPGVPGLDLPGLDIPSVARGFGCWAVQSDTADDRHRGGRPPVNVVHTQPQYAVPGPALGSAPGLSRPPVAWSPG